MNKDDLRLSKFLSLILRHKPQIIGLKLDESGWCNIDELITKINKSGRKITRENLNKIVDTDSKSRYAISPDGLKIRANQGHSIKVNIKFTEVNPPMKLYHGTVNKYIESIKNKGLIKKDRLYVHLSDNIETAIKVGQRRGKAVVLEINSSKMYEDGYKFYISENNVWLCEYVPAMYIKFDE